MNASNLIHREGGTDMKKALVLCLAVVMVVLWIGPASAQYKATMRLASTQPMDHPYMVGAQKFADLINERTNGRIVIKLYPSNQLGKGEREMTEGIQQGAIDLLVTSTGPLEDSALHQHSRLPFLSGLQSRGLVLTDPSAATVDNLKRPKSRPLWENGFRHPTNSKVVAKKGRMPRPEDRPWKTRFISA
jgi:hypothetical protein